MNIRDVKTGTYRPDQLRNGSTGEADRAASGPARSESASAAPADRVEISSASSAKNDPAIQEMAFARKAMLGIPPLSDDRVADILLRVQEGYYSQPEVLKTIAANVAQALTGAAR